MGKRRGQAHFLDLTLGQQRTAIGRKMSPTRTGEPLRSSAAIAAHSPSWFCPVVRYTRRAHWHADCTTVLLRKMRAPCAHVCKSFSRIALCNETG